MTLFDSEAVISDSSSPVMLRNLKAGAGYVLIGFRLIVAPGLKRYVLIPLSINGLLFTVGIAYGAQLLSTLIDAWLPDWLRWLDWLLWPLFGLLVLGAVFFGFTLVANLIAAPFNGRLAQAVETHLRGEPMTAPAGWSTILRELVAGLGAQLRRLVYFGFWSLPFLVLSWIPGLGLFTALGWFFLGAWYMALQYTDYPMANHGLGFPAQRRLLGNRRWLALGFGMAVMVLTLIPVVNFLVMPIAVAAATAMWVGEIWRPSPQGETGYVQHINLALPNKRAR